MASVLLNIANGSVQAIRTIALRARIGNEEQECGAPTVGDPVPAGRLFAPTLASANALANAALECLFPNELQECPEFYTGDPIVAGTVFRSTQLEANLVAASMLECVPDDSLWYLVSEDLVTSGEESVSDAPEGWYLESESP